MSDELNRALGRIEGGLSALGKRVDRLGEDVATLRDEAQEGRADLAELRRDLEAAAGATESLKTEVIRLRATRGLAGALLGFSALAALAVIDAKRALTFVIEWARLK